jgi:hypothetical protein
MLGLVPSSSRRDLLCRHAFDVICDRNLDRRRQHFSAFQATNRPSARRQQMYASLTGLLAHQLTYRRLQSVREEICSISSLSAHYLLKTRHICSFHGRVGRYSSHRNALRPRRCPGGRDLRGILGNSADFIDTPGEGLASRPAQSPQGYAPCIARSHDFAKTIRQA